MTSPSLAILICTMDRPETLRRCLASIAASDIAPSEVLVSDDSQDGQETAAVCAVFSSVRYIAGPRRGLCANRNEVIRQSTSDFVSLLDDDAIVSSDFIGRSFKIIANLNARILVTGAIVETDQLVVPGDPSFLGFFGKPPKNGRLQNINLNCNIFPRHVFNKAKFDEVIVYGYEDMDICSQLLSQGYTIKYDQSLVNTHMPPKRTTMLNNRRFVLSERARFYTSVKRYLLWERSFVKLLAYVMIAPVHRALHAVKTRKWFDLRYAVTDMGFALRESLRERIRLRHERLPTLTIRSPL